MSEAIENTSIGRSHGRLTGPIFLRAVDQLHLLEFRSARSKDWPVNQHLSILELYLEKHLGILGVVADQYVKLATSEILRGTAAAKGNPTELGGKTTDPNSLVAPAILCEQLQQRIALHQFSRLF